MRYIDVHCHPNLVDNHEIAINESKDNGTALIVVGTNISSSKKAIEISEKKDFIWATVGIHPTDLSDNSQSSINNLIEYAKSEKVIAVGECGLDFYHNNENTREAQYELFEIQIDLANKLNKPLMIHGRGSKDGHVNAYLEIFNILKSKSTVAANIHFFSGSVDDARKFLDIGCTVSFTGVITFTEEYDELIKYIPLGNMMTETDFPFVRKQRPVFVKEIVDKIAVLKNIDPESARLAVKECAQRTFKISF